MRILIRLWTGGRSQGRAYGTVQLLKRMGKMTSYFPLSHVYGSLIKDFHYEK
jgi:hypothetical protein